MRPYVKVAGVWRYVYRAVDEHGQVIDVLVSRRRDITAARSFFAAAVVAHGHPDEVVTDRAAVLAYAIADLIPDAVHTEPSYRTSAETTTNSATEPDTNGCASPPDSTS